MRLGNAGFAMSAPGGQSAAAWLAGLVLALTLPAAAIASDEFERESISYSQARPDNRISRLQERIDAGRARPVFEKHLGYMMCSRVGPTDETSTT
jgi:hypothetical protein